MSGPLSGIRVLDVTTTFLGPYCTFVMAQLGADVIKVEHPAGDITRNLTAGRNEGMATTFLAMNAGKRSVVLDLKVPDARAVLHRLAAGADVFIHNMRPTAAARLGLAYKDITAANPAVVYCGAVGFGTEGPYAGKPAYDDIIQAASGIASVQGTVDGRPRYVASVIADKTSALTALYSILAALVHKGRTGAGQEIEVPMFETMAAYILLEQMGGMTFDPPEGPPLYARTISPYRRPYQTSDGYIGVMLYTDEHWRRFLELIDRADLTVDSRFASASGRSANIDEVYAFLDSVLVERSTAEWLKRLTEIDVPAVAVSSIPELFEDPHLLAVDFFRFVDHPTEGRIRTMRNPVRFSTDDGTEPRVAPRLGEHTAEVLREAGFDDVEIGRMFDTGAISGARSPDGQTG